MPSFDAHFHFIKIIMEAVLRALQGVGYVGPAPFVAIVDEVQTIGGDAILNKVRTFL